MKNLSRRFWLTLTLAGLSCASPLLAQAQATWPSKPIRFVVPFAPGGTSEIVARSVAAELTRQLGQSVYVENKPGGAGVTAMQDVARAAPDGHTMILTHVGTMAVNPYMLKNQPYDVNKDFTPVTLLAKVPNVFVIHPDVPAKNFKEFVDYVKARPGQLNYGLSGPGATDHLSGELFNALTGARMVHVPYKGGAPAMLDLIGGNVQLVFSTMSTAVGSIKAGKIRALGMTGNQRFELMPEIPTIAEAGLKGFEANNWYGFFLPAGTPKDIVARLNQETVKALASPDVKQRLLESGIVATSSSPEQFASYIQSETKKWAKVIKDAKIKVE